MRFELNNLGLGKPLHSPTAAWVGRPVYRPGLDNIGTQQPCVLIYSHLLPGITNVTDRAIYYGFYPWFIRAFARRHPDADDSFFRAELRKADCLLTLVAQRHGFICSDPDAGRHGGACPGTQKLGPAVQGLSRGESLSLTRFADRSDTNSDRYFKNSLGGLGQYYLGALRDEMGVLNGDARVGIQFINEIADPIADDFASSDEEALFFEALEADRVGWPELDDLSTFCPCALADGARPKAQARLIQLIFGDSRLDQPKSRRRRSALGLLLSYLHERGGSQTHDPIQSFLAACYSGSLDGKSAWSLPEYYEVVRRSWALYARNEILSLAWLGLFKAALDCLDGRPKPIFSVAQAADWLLSQDEFSYRPKFDFGQMIAEEIVGLPALRASEDERHEVHGWVALTRKPSSPVALAAALLRKLIARHGAGRGVYNEVEVSQEALSGYPLNLESLGDQVRRWSGLSPKAWMRSLLIEVLSAHQRVAIRKLGQSGEDTLMFRTGEGGLFVDRLVDRIPETQPRLRQTLQIVRDLGLCEPFSPGVLPRLTKRGVEKLATCDI